MRKEEVPQVAEPEPMSREPGFECGQTGRRSAVNERRLFSGQEVRRDDPGVPEQEEVEKLGAAT